MPGYDGRGPRGQGKMTGGGRGYCGFGLDTANVSLCGRRGSFGRGGGRGYRNRFYTAGISGWMKDHAEMAGFGDFERSLSKEDQLDILKIQAEFLKDKLASIQSRVQDLEGKEEKKGLAA